jgi:hypothetical protein
MSCPVLGVHGIVLDGGVEPQPVALLAVVEGRLQRTAGAAPATTSAATTTAAATAGGLVALVVVLLGLGALRRSGVELGGDQRVVLGAQIDFAVEIGCGPSGVGFICGLELLVALERLDLLDGDLQLMSDPRVRASLTDPRAYTVEFRSE